MTKMDKQTQRINIKCGTTEDSFDALKQQCEKEAKKLLETIYLSTQPTAIATFWTADFPELIGVGKFYKDENGAVRYDLDFSESTL